MDYMPTDVQYVVALVLDAVSKDTQRVATRVLGGVPRDVLQLKKRISVFLRFGLHCFGYRFGGHAVPETAS
jgi:hypothetical protein